MRAAAVPAPPRAPRAPTDMSAPTVAVASVPDVEAMRLAGASSTCFGRQCARLAWLCSLTGRSARTLLWPSSRRTSDS